jgi:uncharacterized protein (TIGR02145 family)
MKKILLFIFLSIFAFNSCKKSDSSPTQTNQAPASLVLSTPANNATGVSIPCTLTWNASTGATSYRLQLSIDSIFTNTVYDNSNITVTSQQIPNLNNATQYYWRVSATNSYGTSAYSTIWNFTTVIGAFSCGTSTVKYSGKTYHTVQIGSQCWLRENLDLGTRINGSLDQTNNNTIEKYCYKDDPANCTTYGGLYKWAEAVQYKNGATNTTSPNPAFSGNVQGICPIGWHLPTNTEQQALATAVSNDGNALKVVGQGTGSGIGTNTSGFSALLSGYHYHDGTFDDLGSVTNFWSSSEYDATVASDMSLYGYVSDISQSYNDKVEGFSVRCVKDY